MKVQFYYTEDKDKITYIALPYDKDADPPYKDLETNQWKGGQYNWIKVSDLPNYNREPIFPLVEEALKSIPEPSWEDVVPMFVTLDIQCININYSYIE